MFIATPFAGRRAADGSYVALHPSKRAQPIPASSPPKPKVISASTTTAPLIPDKILPGVYLSDILTARAVLSPNYPSPGRPKIRYILSLLDSPVSQPKIDSEARRDNFVLKLILISDKPESDILLILKEACDFIRTSLAKQDGDILVHCQQGVSRSSSVLIAYVMEDMNLDFDTALRFVRERRSKIRPNSGFEKQLRLWSELKFSIFDEDGKEKQKYLNWKKLNSTPPKLHF